MIIYKITNSINNKVYIGQTTLTLQKRWHQHCSKQKMSQKLKGFGLGRSLHESTKFKIAQFNLGKKRPRSVKLAMSMAKNGKQVLMLNSENSVVWKGFLLSDCAQQFNLHVSCIRLCLYGQQKAHKGFTFKYEAVDGDK
jgi:predicted GIY-YIG superfamily endonuclease